jgi:hypothetical protein
MTGWQVLCAVAKSGPGARFLNLDRVRTASVCDARDWTVFDHVCPAQPGGTLRRRPAVGRRRHWLSGEFMLISIGVGFGVATLFATGFLFMAQMFEDFRDA